MDHANRNSFADFSARMPHISRLLEANDVTLAKKLKLKPGRRHR